jgi:hypothetical protein
MGAKAQFMGLVEQGTMHDLDVLRIVTGKSRARVSEELMVAQLRKVKREHAEDIGRLEKLAAAAGVSVQEYVKAYARAHARSTYGAGLDELEKDDSSVRSMLAQHSQR